MLEGLEQVNWRQLQHCYGPATDIPGLLRDLASGDPARARTALDEFWQDVAHQGTIYEATPWAVPFIIELVGWEQAPYRRLLIGLLAAIATAAPYTGRLDDGSEQRRRELEQIRQEELGWARTAQEAVAQGMPLYLSLISHPDPDIGAAAAQLVGCFPSRATELTPMLRRVLDSELADAARASVLLALGILAPHDPENTSRFEDAFRSSAAGRVRLAGALALARTWRGTAPGEAVRVLASAAENPGWVQPLPPWDEIYYGYYDSEADGPFDALLESQKADAGLDKQNAVDFVGSYVNADEPL